MAILQEIAVDTLRLFAPTSVLPVEGDGPIPPLCGSCYCMHLIIQYIYHQNRINVTKILLNLAFLFHVSILMSVTVLFIENHIK